MIHITRRRLFAQAGEMALGFSAASSPLLAGCTAALIGSIAASNAVDAQPVPLPEDQPLPAANTTRNATTGNFASVYAAANAGDHIVLANGNYGAVTLNRVFPSNNKLVIRAQNLLGANATRITFSTLGVGHIISGLNVNQGTSQDTGSVIGVYRHIRITRCRLQNGSTLITVNNGGTDILVDHCEGTRWSDFIVYCNQPSANRRITFARNWFHDAKLGGTSTGGHLGFGWTANSENREQHIAAIVRLNYCGPVPRLGETFEEMAHGKCSGIIYAFNRFDSGTLLLTNRNGLRVLWVGNYGPSSPIRFKDGLGRCYGNDVATIECWGGDSAYSSDTTHLWEEGANNQATNRARIAGNNANVSHGVTGGVSNTWCTQVTAIRPDPMPCGMQKPARSYAGVSYPAHPSDGNVGIKIRAHTGNVTKATSSNNCIDWSVNLDSQPSTAAPTSWRDELFVDYPWIKDLCPNPTSLTGGLGGAAPWSLAQNLTRGDAANANTGPFRNSPGGLP
jgi:hypothetical protein